VPSDTNRPTDEILEPNLSKPPLVQEREACPSLPAAGMSLGKDAPVIRACAERLFLSVKKTY